MCRGARATGYLRNGNLAIDNVPHAGKVNVNFALPGRMR
jgi:hypothetical protein